MDLVGRPLTIGNFVSQSSFGFIFGASTTTFAPYIAIGDAATPNPLSDAIITGTSYQQVLTNFPLSSQILTGLFLNVELSGPNGPVESYQRALLDRIGYTIRQNGGTPAINLDLAAPPPLTDLDLFTLLVQPGRSDPKFPETIPTEAAKLRERLDQLDATANPPDPMARLSDPGHGNGVRAVPWVRA